MERESMDFDMVVIGGGPAGLATAIRFSQLAAQAGDEFTVCLVEKGSEIGAHILSGAVIEPRALNALIPDWKEKGAPLNNTAVTEDDIYYVSEAKQGSCEYLTSLFQQPCIIPLKAMPRASVICVAGSVSKQKKWASCYSPASLQVRFYTTRTAPLRESPPATWVSAHQVSKKVPSKLVTNCMPNTRYSVRVVAATWVKRSWRNLT